MCRSFRATGHSCCGLRSNDEHISTGPALRAVPIALCLHESSGGSPCPLGSHYSIQGPGGEPASAAPGGGRPSPGFACPIRVLRHYVDRTQSFRTSDQLFVCHGGRQKGNAVSKQRMAHWIVDAITLAYQAQGVPCPFRLRAHSTRSVASSWALARGTSLTDICRAVGWATPNTFARFYSLRVEPVFSCVLTSNG